MTLHEDQLTPLPYESEEHFARRVAFHSDRAAKATVLDRPVSSDPVSVQILRECGDLQLKKSRDYQNPNSSIKQADYYPHGVSTILDIIHAKVLRARSVAEAMQNDPNYKPNFESMEDSFKDMCNYASFAASWLRGGIPGQSLDHDFLNRPNKK